MSEKPHDTEDSKKRLLKQNNSNLNSINNKNNIRNGRLKIISFLYTLIFVSIALLQIISIAFFTKGFLLSRQVLDSHSSLQDDIFLNSHELRNFDKAVFVIIDALRFDFTIPEPGIDKPYRNHFTLPYELSTKYPDQAVLLKFVADPPTTTLQRLKGLTTGSLPTFVDAGSNFDGDIIEEDNFIKQLYKHDKRISFVGDDTWEAVFGPFLNQSKPYDSLNVWDLHTVDNGVIENLLPQLESNKDWDVLIGHLLGIDHCGHRYGPDHHLMEEKQLQMNEFLSEVISKIDDDTLLVVFGDHGMDRTGNHGGDSLDELEAALWLYSKKPQTFRPLSKGTYDINENGKNYRSVNQIDLVPTFSLLFGLPIPFNSLGAPIEEAFKSESAFQLANYLTLHQIQRYRSFSTSLKDDSLINAKFEKLIELHQKESTEFNEKFKEYQHASLERCKDLWARFDSVSIYIGITLFAISLLILVVYCKLIPSVVIGQLSEEVVPAVIAMTLLFIVIFGAVSLVLKPTFLSQLWFVLLGAAVGIITGFCIPVFDRYSPLWILRSSCDKLTGFWTLLALIFIFIHAATFASNSFTIWEDRILAHLLITFGAMATIKSLKVPSKVDRVMGIYHSVSFMVITRVTSLITICREEQGDVCIPSFGMKWWVILLLFFFSQFFPSIIKAFYSISDSYQSAAPLWNNLFKIILFLISCYWSMEYIESNQSTLSANILRKLSLSSIHTGKSTIARIIAGVTLVAANYGWSRGPLCVKLDLNGDETSDKEACILGYHNVYGSEYFLLVMNFLAAILLFTKPMGQLALYGLVYQLLAFFELVRILDIRSNLISPTVLGLLGGYYFFKTGHQATIPSINWEIGFTLVDSIIFPLTHIPIALNSFGSFIIIALSVPLITFWRIAPSSKPIALYSTIVENCGTLLAYQTIISLSTLIFATVFKRHLMVWKIFAPRFMFASMVQVVINIVLVVFTIGFGSGGLTIQISKIFGT
ncbi:hypothetical protein WICMUC_004027 [Wickerhamomyces mucosus]|uniref:GPI ethanolamine phosphate transferase 3 n=1 Tax=Wickerhamomyces mucosus TaxID=1378264 RepID=A0A9P8PJR6_9ASCO|nr:hypothetical protein WICMUC_004027 [Wickerhamomyces mucosus]